MKTFLKIFVCAASVICAGFAGFYLDDASKGPAASRLGGMAENGETVTVPFGTVYDWTIRLDIAGPSSVTDRIAGNAQYSAVSTGPNTFVIQAAYQGASAGRRIIIHYKFFRNYWRWWNPWSWFWGYWPGEPLDSYLDR